MRTSVENLQQTRKAPSVNVSPTKQAELLYRTISNYTMLRASESDEEKAYIVTIIGYSEGKNRAEISRLYEERHPLTAVGRAVCEFREEFFCYTIASVVVKIRTEK